MNRTLNLSNTKNIILLFINYFLIFFLDANCIPIILLVTLVSFLLAILLEKKRSAFLFVIGLILELLPLFLFRFTPIRNKFVPIGLSFFVLEALGYTIDVYRGDISAETNFVTYSVFISFFPTFISGPIQRSKGLLVSLKQNHPFNYENSRKGFIQMLFGLFQKFVIADEISRRVNYVYNDYSILSGFTLLIGIFLFSFQLYLDFSGYSNIVLGISKMMGYDLADNFIRPYLSSDIKSFWRRWHISLSEWLRDYIYISLGGNRKGTLRKQINLLITFAVSGIWHGTGWNYLVWGMLHGVYQVIEGYIPFFFNKSNRIIKILLNFMLVTFAWIFFRADSVYQALIICKRIMFSFMFKDTIIGKGYLLGGDYLSIIIIIVGIAVVTLIDILYEANINCSDFILSRAILIRWSIYILLTLFILFGIARSIGLSSGDFIYAQF